MFRVTTEVIDIDHYPYLKIECFVQYNRKEYRVNTYEVKSIAVAHFDIVWNNLGEMLKNSIIEDLKNS